MHRNFRTRGEFHEARRGEKRRGGLYNFNTMQDFSKLAMLFGAVLGIAFLGVIVIILVRRYFLGNSAPEAALPFTLQDLREMHARGEITATEFETMRSAMIGSHAAAKTQPRDRTAASKREIPEPPQSRDDPGDSSR